MCHGFLALRESGERLSHAVGCAFAACLERKQRRDKECGVTMMFDQTNNTFTRTGSFRQHSITEKMERENDNPKPLPVNPFAIERPHATPHMLERQGSFRGLSQLGNNSPFKRQMSLRVNDLPSNTERLRAFTRGTPNNKAVSPIPEISPGDSVTALCQQLSQGLSQLTHSGSDDFNFNSQMVNQNVFATIEHSDSIEFSSNIITTPTSSRSATVASIGLSLSPGVSQPTTPIANRSPNPSIISGAFNNSSLPKPEQWLGQIVNSTSPALGVEESSPRRQPMLGVHSRTMSLGSAESFGRMPNQVDPFDAEWAAIATRQSNAQNTNPFLNSTTPQAFQVRL